jgi:hypothetical protein
MTHRVLGLSVAALLGIVLTVALTWSIGRLAGQHIGLASEPLSVVRGLAPPPSTRVDQPKRAGTDGGGAGDRKRPTGPRSPTTADPSMTEPVVRARQGPALLSAHATASVAPPGGAPTLPAGSSGAFTGRVRIPGGDGQGGVSGESGGAQHSHAGGDD